MITAADTFEHLWLTLTKKKKKKKEKKNAELEYIWFLR